MKKTFFILVCMLFYCGIRLQAQVVNKAYGNNMKQVDVIAGVPVFAIYSGDIDQDGFVTANDFALQMDFDIQNGAFGYVVTDLDGDGFVTANDFALILDGNIQNGVFSDHP